MKCCSHDEKLEVVVKNFEHFLKEYQVADTIPIFPEFKEEERIQLLLYTVAICHNMNWKYLCSTVMYRIWEWSVRLDIDKLLNMSVEQMETFFLDYPKKHKIEAKRRTNMIKSIALVYKGDKNLIKKIRDSKTIKGPNGLLEILNQLPVYKEDPLHKKSNFLAQVLIDEKILKVEDPEKIEPLVDYHIMRLYLRTGRIEVLDEIIKKKIKNKEQLPVEQITQIRTEISEQIKRFCTKYNKTVRQLNTIDWYVARNYCRQEKVNCEECPFHTKCDSRKLPLEEMLIEAIDNHGYY